MATLSGGKKLEGALRALADKIAKPATLRVGFLEGSTYPDGTPTAMIAAIQDFGAPKAGIPPRPFFRDMIKDNRGDWPALVASQLKVADGDAELALDRVGDVIAGQLTEAIRNAAAPPYEPLKPATVKRKGFDKLLIDTGHLIDSVSWAVKA